MCTQKLSRFGSYLQCVVFGCWGPDSFCPIRLLAEMLKQVIYLSGFLPGPGRGARVVGTTVTEETSVFIHSILYGSGYNSGD